MEFVQSKQQKGWLLVALWVVHFMVFICFIRADASVFPKEQDFDSNPAWANYNLPKAKPSAFEALQFKRLYFAFLESISLPFQSDMRLLIVSFISAPSCFECC